MVRGEAELEQREPRGVHGHGGVLLAPSRHARSHLRLLVRQQQRASLAALLVRVRVRVRVRVGVRVRLRGRRSCWRATSCAAWSHRAREKMKKMAGSTWEV